MKVRSRKRTYFSFLCSLCLLLFKEFPFRCELNMQRIYLDNAATSWPKPNAVYDTVDRYQREVGASAGRGAYQNAQQAQRVVAETRAACARLLGIASAEQLVITSGGTAALNLAIHGLLKPGDHVVTTVAEHNSVLRPLHWQAEHNGVEVVHVECDTDGYVDPAAIAASIHSKTRLVVVTHASNVTGAIQPVAEMARATHEAGALLLVDAAQTAGCIPLDVEALGIDMLACGGHKGLLGPLGTGLLYMRTGLEQLIQPQLQGGTGTDSLAQTQPDELPSRFEPGSLNVPALAGLCAAMEFLEKKTIAAIQAHHEDLTQQLLAGLETFPGIQVFGPAILMPRVAVVSFAAEGYDPQEFAAALDASCGIECRAGLHCAPLMHKSLGTVNHGGLVRFSPGWATSKSEIEQTLEAVSVLANQSLP